jgi:hypothetical protein
LEHLLLNHILLKVSLIDIVGRRDPTTTFASSTSIVIVASTGSIASELPATAIPIAIVRASPLTHPMRPLTPVFFIRTA